MQVHARSIALGVVCLALVAAANAQTLARRIDRAIAASPQASRAFIGIHAVDLATGHTLYEQNPDHFFVPASNTKLFTTALALYRLGPEFRFTTRVAADSAIGADGRLAGDLVLVGGGDPTLSARVYPYQKDPPKQDPLRAIEALASQLAERGLRRVDGDLVGDDTAFVWEPYPGGWGQGDPVWEYGAPVSALTLDDNAFRLTVRPGDEPGDPARIQLEPALEYFRVINRIETIAPGVPHKIHIDRAAGSRELRLWGTIPAGSAELSELLAIDDPALYAAAALRDALARRGIEVRGTIRARHRLPDQTAVPGHASVELARLESPPLAEILQVMDKVSQNLHAEIVLREVGLIRQGMGSREAGLKEMAAFLNEAGIEPDDYYLQDGSGLSRLNLITPRDVTTLLGFLYRSRFRDQWTALLPIGGEDGTLQRRFAGKLKANEIHAKTGTLGHVMALSGYAGGKVAFSILVNNHAGHDAEFRKMVDSIALEFTGAKPAVRKRMVK